VNVREHDNYGPPVNLPVSPPVSLPISPLASPTLTEHLLRGAAGIAALIAALLLAAELPLVSLALGVLALLALRGCPTCWTLGLIETASCRLRARQPPSRED
jgi:hypothetical protein